jgi:hypothetical protein
MLSFLSVRSGSSAVNESLSLLGVSMVSFWGTAAAAMSAKLERLRDAERALLDLAVHSSSDDHRPIIASVDTPIPVRTIHPSIDGNATSELHIPCLVGSTVQKDGQNCYVIHSISVSAPKTSLSQAAVNKTPPLVLLHGYSKWFFQIHFSLNCL